MPGGVDEARMARAREERTENKEHRALLSKENKILHSKTSVVKGAKGCLKSAFPYDLSVVSGKERLMHVLFFFDSSSRFVCLRRIGRIDPLHMLLKILLPH